MPTDIPAAGLARWAELVERATALDAEHAAMFNEWAGTPNEIALREERDNARLAMAEQFSTLLAGYAAKVAECEAAERVVGELEAALRAVERVTTWPEYYKRATALASAAAWQKGTA